MADLTGKTAVITGAASGIGRETVEVFVKAGAQVVAADIQDERGQELVEQFGVDKVRYVQCDVTRRQDFDAAIRTCVSDFGGLDILFNNAGAGGNPCGIEEFDPEGFDFTVNLLLKSVLLGSHLAVPHMKARGGGAIINTSSVSASQAGAAPMVYSLCKKAVAHLSKIGASELSKYNIRVNAVLPGLIGTHIFGKGFGLSNEEAQQVADLLAEHAGAMQPIGRIGQGKDVGEMVAFLASDAASFLTDGEFVVDGGMTIGPPDSWQSDKPLAAIGALMGYSAEELEKKFAEASARTR